MVSVNNETRIQNKRYMIYLFGIVGAIVGFSIGLGTINVMLRNVPKEKLQSDQSIKWKYGLLVWGFFGLGGWLGVWIYNNHFF